MFTRIREINTLSTWDGNTYQIDILEEANESIYIARDDSNKFGVVRPDDTEVLPFEYERIAPLGFGLWEMTKHGKVGAFKLGYSSEQLLEIKWMMHSCEYDYMSAEHGNLIKASKYDSKTGIDLTDIIFPSVGEVFYRAEYDSISWDYYYIRQDVDGKWRPFLINQNTGKRFDLDRDFVLIGLKYVDQDYFLMFEDPKDENAQIIKISSNGLIGKTHIFDCVPTVIYDFDDNGMDEAAPIGFICKKRGLHFFVDSDLVEHNDAIDNLDITLELKGKIVGGENVSSVLSKLCVENEVHIYGRKPQLLDL